MFYVYSCTFYKPVLNGPTSQILNLKFGPWAKRFADRWSRWWCVSSWPEMPSYFTVYISTPLMLTACGIPTLLVFFIGRSISDDIKLFSDILVHPQTSEVKVQPSNVYESVFGFGKKKFLVKTTGILWMENICPHPRPLETNSRSNQILINFSW